MGRPVARSAANPWAPGFENIKRTNSVRVDPTAARVWPKLFSAKALASAAKPDPADGPSGRRAKVGDGLVLGLRKSQKH